MLIRYQMGARANWDALELSAVLMHRLEPNAMIHVVCQGDVLRHTMDDFVTFHRQTLPDGVPYCSGRHMPERLAPIGEHEVYMDNDHIMWELPEGWKRFAARREAVLVWLADWQYYGAYDSQITDWDASAGMWGVPPGCTMPFPEYIGGEKNQDEYGWVVKFLQSWPEHEFITQAEVPIYCPEHNALRDRNRLGTHGVHLNGLNRCWNPGGAVMLEELRRKYL